jgi:hypothetical protein
MIIVYYNIKLIFNIFEINYLYYYNQYFNVGELVYDQPIETWSVISLQNVST